MLSSESVEEATAARLLDVLEPITVTPASPGEGKHLRPPELLHSVLSIAGLTQLSESALVREVVKNALGRLPSLDE